MVLPSVASLVYSTVVAKEYCLVEVLVAMKAAHLVARMVVLLVAPKVYLKAGLKAVGWADLREHSQVALKG